jgi:hypothetical protein
MSGTCVYALAAVLLTAEYGGESSPGQVGDSELEKGVRQAQEGEYDQAVVTLDRAVKRLGDRGAPARDLSRAHVYLAVAYVGLGQEQAARGSFLEALRVDPTLELAQDEYPARIVRFFDEVRRSEGLTRPAAAGEAPRRPGPAPAPEKKGRSRTPLVLLGVAGAAGVGAAVALGGGGGGGDTASVAAPAPQPPAAVTGTLTIVGLSPPAGSTIKVPGRSIAAGSGLLEMRFGAVTSADVSAATLYVGLRKENGVYAVNTWVRDLKLRAGEPTTIVANSFTLSYDPPFETTHIEVILSGPTSEPIVTAYFNSVGYSFAGP